MKKFLEVAVPGLVVAVGLYTRVSICASGAGGSQGPAGWRPAAVMFGKDVPTFTMFTCPDVPLHLAMQITPKDGRASLPSLAPLHAPAICAPRRDHVPRDDVTMTTRGRTYATRAVATHQETFADVRADL